MELDFFAKGLFVLFVMIAYGSWYFTVTRHEFSVPELIRITMWLLYATLIALFGILIALRVIHA